MKNNSVLNKNCIDLNLKSTTREGVLEELTDILYENKIIDDKEGFLKDVYIREQVGSTGVGNHIALPHGKSKYVRKASIVVGKTNCEIEWGSVDGLPVSFFILFAVPEDGDIVIEGKVISSICIKLADDDICRLLLDAKSNEEVFDILYGND